MERQREEAGQSPGWPDITIAGVAGPFTGRCQAAVDAAREAAGIYRHGYVGTEHLLLGLLSVREGVAAQVLGNLGITADRVRSWIDFRIGPCAEKVSPDDVEFTPRAKQTLQLAVVEHRRLGHLDVGTEHLLLGVAGVEGGSGATILTDYGVNYEMLRGAVIAFLAQASLGNVMVTCSLSPDLVAALDDFVASRQFDSRAEAVACCVEDVIGAGLHPPGHEPDGGSDSDAGSPGWYVRMLVHDRIPWKWGAITTMPTFCAHYDLHDGTLIGLWNAPDSGAVVAVHLRLSPYGFPDAFDAWYTADERRLIESDDDGASKGYDLVLFRFPRLYQFAQSNDPKDPEGYLVDTYLNGVESRPLVGEEFARWQQAYGAAYDADGRGTAEIAEGGVFDTVFESSGEYVLRLVHGTPVAVLAINAFGRIIPLPGL